MSKIKNDNQTKGRDYTTRLVRLESAWFKKILHPINPYRLNIRRMAIGIVLDVGCGIGRNLRYLKSPDAIGVDHNAESVQFVQQLGYKAFLVNEFLERHSKSDPLFDTLLISHVVEHMSAEAAKELVRTYLKFLKPNGRVVLICPQQRGYASDQTHETYFTSESLSLLVKQLGLEVVRVKSFPLPRFFGKMFIYNEHIVIAQKHSLTI